MSFVNILFTALDLIVIFALQQVLFSILRVFSYSERERYKQTRLFISVFVATILFGISVYIESKKGLLMQLKEEMLYIFLVVIAGLILIEFFIRRKFEKSKFAKYIKDINLSWVKNIFYEENIFGKLVLKNESITFKNSIKTIIDMNVILIVIIPLLRKAQLINNTLVILPVLIAFDVVFYELLLFLSNKEEVVKESIKKINYLESPEEWAKSIVSKYGEKVIAYTNATTTLKEEVSTTLNNLQLIVKDLLEGKNMMIGNSSKNETKAVYYNAINKNFINNKATLIIFEDLPSVKEAKQIIDSIVDHYNNELVVRAVTKIQNESVRIDKDVNIYIATMQDLSDSNIEYGDIQTIIINNYDKIIQKNPNELYVLSTTLKKVNKNYQYILLSSVTDSLRNASKNILLLDSFTEYQINRKKASQTLSTQIIKGEFDTIRDHKDNFNYINDLINIAMGTNKYNVENIEIMSKKLPILSDSAKFDVIRANRTNRLTNTDLNKLTSRIRINNNNLFQENARTKMFLKHDDEKNIVYNIKSYSELNDGETYLGIIANNYLLRDYMIDEYLNKGSNSEEVDIIVPQTMKNDSKILLGTLLLQMLNVPVKEEIILRRLKEYDSEMEVVEGYNKLNLVTTINTLIKEEFGIETDITNYLVENVDEKGKLEYSLSQNFKDKLPKDLCNKSKIILGGYEKELTALKGYEINQKYIPGQVHLMENEVYRIEDIDGENIKVSNIQDEEIKLYKQDKEVAIKNKTCKENVSEIKEYSNIIVKKEIENVDMEISTLGYYEFANHTNLGNGEFVYRKLLDSQVEKIKRTYYNQRVIKLTFCSKKKKDADEELTSKTAYTLSLLLNEVFESLLDENSPYIMVKAAVKDKEILRNKTSKLYRPIIDDTVEENTIVIYIIEDLKISKGLISTIENELPRIMKILKKYLKWCLEDKEERQKYLKGLDPSNILTLEEIKKILPAKW